jgi:type IV pilus assembly protein PilN
VELVRNLEHSRRFFEPRIVGESSAETSSGANQRLEPVSATNRFNFDLLAEYNPPTPEESRFTANAKKIAAAEPEDATSLATPAQGSGITQRRVRPPYTGPTPKPNPTQGEPR